LTTGNVVFEPGVWLAVEFDWENADIDIDAKIWHSILIRTIQS
jgi:hypothetical protein